MRAANMLCGCLLLAGRPFVLDLAAADTQDQPSPWAESGPLPTRVHVFEDYETDIERRWWLRGEPQAEHVPASLSNTLPNRRACRAIPTKDFDDLMGDAARTYRAVIFNPVPGPPMGDHTRLGFRYFLRGTDTLRVQIYSLTNNYHRRLVLTGLPQDAWQSATVDMTQARRPDGSGGPLSRDERIDDIQFYVDEQAELVIDDIVLYEAGPDEDGRAFPRRVIFTGWFDTGEQGAEWPGEFQIVKHEPPGTWDAAASVPNTRTGQHWLRIGLRGERPLSEWTQARFRYRLSAASEIRVALGDEISATLREPVVGEWAEAELEFAAPRRDLHEPRTADEICFFVEGGATLLIDDLLLYEPGPGAAVEAGRYDQLRVGDEAAGRFVVPTNQVLSPLGRQVSFPGRPTDLALSPDGRWLAVLGNDQVLVIDPNKGEIVARAAHASGSVRGILFTRDSRRLLASSFQGTIGVFDIDPEGKMSPQPPLRLPGPADGRASNPAPAGLALAADGKALWAVLNLSNTLAELDLASGSLVREIPVGSAPYDVVVVGQKAYVSNWAGRHPGPGDPAGPSGRGTPVRVDPARNIAADGSVSVVDLTAGRELKQIVVGLHPAGLAASPDGRWMCVANANSDTVSVISTGTDEVVETLSTRPHADLLFGSAPNALVFSPDGKSLYVANGGNNAIAVLAFDPPRTHLEGCLPTGWYPAGLVCDGERQALYVANLKGTGSRFTGWQGSRAVKGNVVFGYNSHDYLGTVSLMPLPAGDELAAQTQAVLANNRLTEAESALAPPRPDAPPRPVPERHGEPSVFKHVLYIIKENRTYDQVFGDMERAEGDPQLCIFGSEVTPNHHKLADAFVLLDNFYCSGVLSADGHQWTDEAYVTDYLEKSFGGFPRSYPFDGGDAMAYASSGFLWDNALASGRTLRVYGEFVAATVRWRDTQRSPGPTFLDCYQEFLTGTDQIEVRANAAIKTLVPYLCPTAIGFPSTVPDVYRAEQFIRELKEFERRGELPNLMILMLPNDHTSGTRPGLPTPEAAVADNDLALGRLVDAVSHSKFWSETCIFVVEDDPQNGYDHIDGHRTVALVASPYTRRQAVDSTNYNQTSMVRTIELILGLPPMNQFDASATPMASCFAAEPDLASYEAVPNNIPLDRLNPELAQIRDPAARHWAEVSLALPLDDVDEADEDTLNRILWHAIRGRDDTYPSWAVGVEHEENDDDK